MTTAPERQRPRMKMEPMLRLMELADYAIPFTLRAAAAHGFADLLADGPRPATELAAATGLSGDIVERLLRALSCKEIVTVQPGEAFALAPLALPLRSDHPESVRESLALDPAEVHAWADAGLRLQHGLPAADQFAGYATGALATSPAGRRLQELADYPLATTIRALAELRVADHLSEAPRPVGELAAATGADSATLLAALRLVAGRAVVTEPAPEQFASTDLAELMRTDLPYSLQGCLPLMPADLRAWAAFEFTLRTGEPAFTQVHGETYYDYLAQRPAENRRFDASQEGATRLELRAALRGYDWTGLTTLVDVGGGNGTFLAGILRRQPRLHGVLFDLPFVVALADEVLGKQQVADRCSVVGGSFFDDPVPAGHDAYLIKRTLYNWDRDSAVRILRAVRTAMRPDSRLLIFEPTRRPDDTFDVARLTDVIMAVFTGGALRSIEQISELLTTAGLRLERTIPTPMFPILQAAPA